MPTCIALLRAVNVAGHQPVKMAALRESFEALGFDHVRTYLQSGNVVFGAPKTAPAALAQSVERRLLKDFDFPIRVLVKSEREMQQVLADNPFLSEAGIDPAKLHVAFPFQAPADAALRKLDALAKGRDRFSLVGGAIYLHCPDGYGRSKLSSSTLERVLAVETTTRNWRTVGELCRLAAE